MYTALCDADSQGLTDEAERLLVERAAIGPVISGPPSFLSSFLCLFVSVFRSAQRHV